MEEIFEIEEQRPQVFIHEHNTAHQGHTHDNNIEEITKWINNKFVENLNITIDDCVQSYDNNKTIVDRIICGLLIFLMICVAYSIMTTLYNFFHEIRQKRILRNLQNTRNMRKAE